MVVLLDDLVSEDLVLVLLFLFEDCVWDELSRVRLAVRRSRQNVYLEKRSRVGALSV